MVARELAHTTPRRMTREEYDRMVALGFFRDERVELIRGIVVRMSPIGPPHSSVVELLNELLVRALAGRARVRIQLPFLAADGSEPEPDVAVVPVASYKARHPDRALLLIEVAESSLDYDRETKGALYAASGVPEYWVVDVKAQAIEVHSGPAGDRYEGVRRVEADGSLSPAAFADVAIRVAELFV